MKSRRKFLKIAGFIAASGLALRPDAWAAPTSEALTPADLAHLPDGIHRVDLFLLIGQSNMKGRGEIPKGEQPNPRIVMMSMEDDHWSVARDPLHARGQRDKVDGSDNAGVGPGRSFANTLAAREPGVMIGLIPCAVGGSPVRLWQKGVNRSLYDNALRRVKLALATNPKGKATVRAALWLQGESNATEQLYTSYEASFLRVVDNLRADLDQPDLPFLACTIGSFLKGHKNFTRSKEINEILLGLPVKRPHTACVDARDLDGHIGDRVHYNTDSQIKIGRRYAEEFIKLNNQQPKHK